VREIRKRERESRRKRLSVVFLLCTQSVDGRDGVVFKGDTTSHPPREQPGEKQNSQLYQSKRYYSFELQTTMKERVSSPFFSGIDDGAGHEESGQPLNSMHCLEFYVLFPPL